MDGTVLIHIVSAHGVAEKDRIGKVDPYVKVTLGGRELAQTDVIKNTQSPVWNYKFKFHVSGPFNVEDTELCFLLYDKDRFSRDDRLGEVRLSLDKIINAKLPGKTFMLGSAPGKKDKVAGSLTLDVVYEPGPQKPASAHEGYLDAHAFHWENGKLMPGNTA